MNRAKKILYTALIVICIVVMLFSAYKITKGIFDYREADEFYSELRQNFASYETRLPSEDTVDTAEPSIEPSGITIDFEGLLLENADIVGWLYCENTVMDYPVVKGSDNDYYLRRNLYGEYLVTGTIFADFRCDEPIEDPCYLIFGHNMDNGTIFGMLRNYLDPSYMAEHPVYQYYTPERAYEIEVLSAVTVTTDEGVYSIGSEGEDYCEYMRGLCERGTHSECEIMDEDRFFVLSTCTAAGGSERFLLIGRVSAEEKNG